MHQESVNSYLGVESAATLRIKASVPPPPPVRNTSITSCTTAAELSKILHDIAEQRDEERTAVTPTNNNAAMRFSLDSISSVTTTALSTSSSSSATLQSFGSPQRSSGTFATISQSSGNNNNGGHSSNSTSMISLTGSIDSCTAQPDGVADGSVIEQQHQQQLLLQQRRWTPQQQQQRHLLTMNLHEHHRLSDPPRDASSEHTASPTPTISSPSCSSIASSSGGLSSDKRSLWSFGSKFSPRRSADMSDKFTMKTSATTTPIPTTINPSTPVKQTQLQSQSAAADYVNLPFDFAAASLANNGNQSPLAPPPPPPHHHQHHPQYATPVSLHKNGTSTHQQQQQPPHQHHHHQAPEIVSRSQDCVIPFGATAILSCRIRNHEHASITWRKTEPNPAPIAQSAKFNYIVTAAGEARLMIAQAAKADGGLYVCAVANRYGITQCTIGVSVLSSQLDVLTERNVEAVGPTVLRVSWESLNTYVIEVLQLPAPSTPSALGGGGPPAIAATAGKWQRLDGQLAVRSKHIVHGLSAGETYQVRLVCPSTGAQSAPSPALTMPISEQHMWQQQQFANRYAAAAGRQELGRGRFAVCRVASDLVTRQPVALKQVSRRHQELEATQEEYRLLASAQHPNIVRALALFENAPTPGADTIVMELVEGPHLFSYVCQLEHYSELIVHSYMRQLVSALHWLHDRHTAHLDVKPENVMVHLPAGQHHAAAAMPPTHLPPGTLKLIDFGESAVRCMQRQRDTVLPPANLEFAAPEMVMGQPLSEQTDSWCFGILMYVFLSGVSPFLDDSVEETTANILKCDFSFPDDYFADISGEAMALLGRLLVLPAGGRASMAECQQSAWFVQEPQRKPIPKTQLEAFNERRMRNSVSAVQSAAAAAAAAATSTIGAGSTKLT